jgi:hypothetical protein
LNNFGRNSNLRFFHVALFRMPAKFEIDPFTITNKLSVVKTARTRPLQ